MKNSILIFLFLFTYLCSQDVLITNNNKTFKGKLIKTTKTGVLFQIEGKSIPYEVPEQNIKSLILNDDPITIDDNSISQNDVGDHLSNLELMSKSDYFVLDTLNLNKILTLNLNKILYLIKNQIYLIKIQVH